MSNSASGSNHKINGCVRADRTVCPFRQQIRERKQPMLSLSYLATSAGTDASVDGGQSPFIKIVDKEDWLCYFVRNGVMIENSPMSVMLYVLKWSINWNLRGKYD